MKLATAMHHTAFVPYSVIAGCSLTGNTHELLPVLCYVTVVTFDPGIFPSVAIVLLGICYDPILSKEKSVYKMDMGGGGVRLLVVGHYNLYERFVQLPVPCAYTCEIGI